MKTVLSIDIGTKCIAFCVLRFAHDDSVRVVSIFLNEIRRVNGDWCRGVCNTLDALILPPITDVLIERQSKKGIIMCAVQNYCHMYYVKAGVRVHIVAAHIKLRGLASFRGKAMYSERKKAASAICARWLRDTQQDESVISQYHGRHRTHDIADALLQALQWADVEINIEAGATLQTVCDGISKRKPSAKQLATGKFSKSNLKHFISTMTIDQLYADHKIYRAMVAHFGDPDKCMSALR